MRLPEVADRLRTIAALAMLPELNALAEHIRRRPSGKRAAKHSTPMTPELRHKIRDYAAEHPKLSQLKIARVFNVSQGRVSESLKGKRT